MTNWEEKHAIIKKKSYTTRQKDIISMKIGPKGNEEYKK